MYCSQKDGVLFVEGEPQEARLLGPVACKIGGLFTQAQIKSLDDVKGQLASQAKRHGANAVVRFAYGQKSTFLGTVFGLDDVTWHGEGQAAQLPAEVIEALTRAQEKREA